MNTRITEISISPFLFAFDEKGCTYSRYNEGLGYYREKKKNIWNVHAFDMHNGEANVFDDSDFDSFGAAWAYAKDLSVKYQVKIG